MISVVGVDKVTVGAVVGGVSTFVVAAGAGADADAPGVADVPGEDDSPELGLPPAAASPGLAGPAKLVLPEQDTAMTERLTIVAVKQGFSAKWFRFVIVPTFRGVSGLFKLGRASQTQPSKGWDSTLIPRAPTGLVGTKRS